MAANPSPPSTTTSSATGTHQLSATQSIQDPDSAGAAAGGFFTGGAGTAAGGASTGGAAAGGVAATGGVAAGGVGVAGATRGGVALVGGLAGGAAATGGGGGTPSLRCSALSSLFRMSISRFDSASCPSRSLTRSLSACASALEP